MSSLFVARLLSHCARPSRGSDLPLYQGVVGLSFTARIGRAQFYRARSASKKDSRTTPSPLLPPFPTRPSTHSAEAAAEPALSTSPIFPPSQARIGMAQVGAAEPP